MTLTWSFCVLDADGRVVDEESSEPPQAASDSAIRPRPEPRRARWAFFDSQAFTSLESASLLVAFSRATRKFLALFSMTKAAELRLRRHLTGV